jgi:hypothetical protein
MTRLERSPTSSVADVLVARPVQSDFGVSGRSDASGNLPKAEGNPVPEPSSPQAHASASKLTAAQIQLDEFIAVASRAALQVLAERQVALNPQPLPPGEAAAIRPGGRIITGIVFELQ